MSTHILHYDSGRINQTKTALAAAVAFVQTFPVRPWVHAWAIHEAIYPSILLCEPVKIVHQSNIWSNTESNIRNILNSPRVDIQYIELQFL